MILSKEKINYLVFGILGIFLGSLVYTFLFPNYFEYSQPVEFEIKKGETLQTIIKNLEDEKIIPSSFNLTLAAKIYRADKDIKAGKYLIPNGLNYFQLLNILIKGTPEETVKVTIPEGIWQKELANLLAKEMNIDAGKFLELCKKRDFIDSLGLKTNNLIGYLLPETYYFIKNSDERRIIKKLVSEQNKIFESDSVKNKLNELGYSRHQILTLASIVNAESSYKDEMRTIAGVYYNRLKRGMLLQADPTIKYLAKQKRRRVRKIYYKDLAIDSPYNTYKYVGLPPGPIANPGKDAILATIFPEKNDYFYFVADGKGRHNFSKSFTQHLKNVRTYRQWRSNQR